MSKPAAFDVRGVAYNNFLEGKGNQAGNGAAQEEDNDFPWPWKFRHSMGCWQHPMLELFYDQDDNEFYDGEGAKDPDFDDPMDDEVVIARVKAKCIPEKSMPRRWREC